MPEVSIVVVSYRTREMTRACLVSLAPAAEGVDHEIIVVDNDSGDGTAEMVRAEFPAVRLLCPEKNLGFACGANLGVDASTGASVLLVNPDAVLERGSVRRLLEVAAANPDAGLVGGQLLDDRGGIAPESYSAAPSLWGHLCFALGLTSLRRGSRLFDPGFLRSPRAGETRRVGYVTGALLLVSRSLWDRLGGFDPSFAMYGEDADLGLRAARLGLRPLVTSEVSARHRSGASTSAASRRATMLLAGKVTLLRKHWRPPAAALGTCLLLAGVRLRAAASRVARLTGRPADVWPAVWAEREEWRGGYPLGRRPEPALRVMGWPAHYGSWANPYTSLLAQACEARGDVAVEDFSRRRLLSRPPDVLHVHWPDWPLRSARPLRDATLALATIALARRRGTRLVWTGHDVVPHERFAPRWARLYWAAFVRRVDGTITLSEPVQHELLSTYPGLAVRPSRVVPHGHYRDAYPPAPGREAALATLGLEASASVLLFFGQLRPYKGLPALLDAFSRLRDEQAVLLVAGAPATADLTTDLRRRAAADPRIRLDLRRIPDGDVPGLLAAADAVVLPYARIWSSGAALLALSFDRPVLLPDTPAFRELAEVAGERWVRRFQPPLTEDDLAGLLADLPAGAPTLTPFEWPAIADATVAHYFAVRKAS